MKIVVTTPTGHIGSKLANILLDRGAEITVIARSPEKVQNLSKRGAKVVQGEHGDAEVLSRALEDADRLFWVTPPFYASHDPLGDARRFAETGAEAIQKHKDMHVVQVSSAGAHRQHGPGPIEGLRQTEEFFRAAGKNVTSLRPNWFMENVLESLPTIVSDGAIFTIASGSTRAPQIASQDIAQIASDFLLARKDGHLTVDIAGPLVITLDQSAEILTKTIGKTVRVVTIPAENLKKALISSGVSKEMADLFIEMEQEFNNGLALEHQGDIHAVGKITFEQFAKDVFLPAYREIAKVAKAS